MLSWFQRWSGFSSSDNAGVRGEKQASAWLEKNRGFVVVARNWRDPRDRRREIDLVCRDREILVFVEVKARSANALVPGYYAVDKRKRKVMKRAIDAYLSLLRPAPRTFRFDVVEVSQSMGGGATEVLHFENIPLFPKQYRG
jgi:putative endonuclease